MINRNFPFEIFDAHHHLWDLKLVQYPWLEAKGVKRFFGDPSAIQKNYLVSDLRDDIGVLPVTRSVHIEVGAAEGQRLLESQTIQSMAHEHGMADAIVAFAPLDSDNLKQRLDAFQVLENFRGVRQIVGRSPEEDKVTGTDTLIANTKWLNGLRELERRSLSFDLQLIPDQMQAVAEVLHHVPDLNVALCHCGSPWYRDKPGWQLWQSGLRSIAELPNTMCKVSGLSMFDHNWTVNSLRPIVECVIETFGAERVMLGSNFPVDKLHTSYQRLWWAYLEILDSMPSLTRSQKQALFRNNCARFYRIGD